MARVFEQRRIVLLVEDDKFMRELIGRSLRHPLVEVHTATNGVEGIFKARMLKPDLVVLDVMMPVMDGLSVFRTLRRDAGLGRTKYMIVTARTVEGALEMARDLGATTVNKPFRPMELRRTAFDLLSIAPEGDEAAAALAAHPAPTPEPRGDRPDADPPALGRDAGP